MKVLMLSHSNGGGGAGRATDRLFHALDEAGTDLRMHVDFKHGDDPRVITNTGPLAEQRRSARIHLDEIPAVTAGHPHPELFSPATQSALTAKRIDAMGADIVDLHWINFGYLSIRELGRIQTPLVWHMHDMWAFTGGENYTDDGPDARWRSGYTTPAPYPLRWDVERWVYERKRSHWSFPRAAVAPSRWLAELARQSPLLADWSVRTIPNPVDVNTYAPQNKDAARARLGLAQDPIYVLAVVGGTTTDPRKGVDLLLEALHRVPNSSGQAVEILIVGGGQPPPGWSALPLKNHWLGILGDDDLIAAYNAADVVVVPSRQDNLPQTGTEAQACGIPVVAFNTGGLGDVIEDEATGLLAVAHEPDSLAAAISRLLESESIRSRMGEAARARAVRLWSPPNVAALTAAAFEEIRQQQLGRRVTA